jgi:peptidoglycan pentaglycine glycine transferase (the first glycine)
MEFRVAGTDEVAEWEDFAANHPEGRVFHSVKYVDTLREWSHDHELLVARRNGAVAAGALIHSRPLPGLGWRSANIEGGILIKEPRAELLETLYPSLIRHLKAHSYVDLRLHMRVPVRIDGRVVEASLLLDEVLRRHGARREEILSDERTTGTYVVSLQREDEDLLASFSRNCRRDVRKAEREGLSVEHGDDPSLLETFYDQHSAMYRRKGLTFPLRGPFMRSSERAMRCGLIRIYWARFAGRIVNMALVSRFGVPMFTKGASIASVLDEPVPPSGQLLHFEIMRRLRGEGFREYDLGGSPGLEPVEGHPNYPVWRFKRGFGGAFHQDLGVYYATLDRMKQRIVSLARGVHGRLSSLRATVEDRRRG